MCVPEYIMYTMHMQEPKDIRRGHRVFRNWELQVVVSQHVSVRIWSYLTWSSAEQQALLSAKPSLHFPECLLKTHVTFVLET